MTVVHIPAHFRQYTAGEATVEVPGGTLRQVIDALDTAHPGMRELLMARGRVRSEIAIAVNSTVTENNLLEPIPDEAEVHLVPAIAGGSEVNPDAASDANERTRQAWDENAEFWNDRMGDGNDFVRVLSWPATERLLAVEPGERFLDIACGNGLTSRRIAALGATEVVACDFAPRMLEAARGYAEHAERIEYHLVDATDEAALRALGAAGSFDGALCAMALFDMAEIEPTFRALSGLVREGGRFVASVIHPAFNNNGTALTIETEDLVTRRGVRVWEYMTSSARPAVAIEGAPTNHLLFHRPLQELLAPAFAAGWVLDGLEERAFPADAGEGNPRRPSWRDVPEIPPVLVLRFARVPR